MPGEDGNVVVEGPELFADAIQEELMIAAGQVGAADAASEEDISAKEYLALAVQETDTARAMAGDVQHLEIDSFYRERRGFGS